MAESIKNAMKINFDTQTFDLTFRLKDNKVRIPNTVIRVHAGYSGIGKCESLIIMEGFCESFKLRFRGEFKEKILGQLSTEYSADVECEVISDDQVERTEDGKNWQWKDGVLEELSADNGLHFKYELTDDDFFAKKTKRGPLTDDQKTARAEKDVAKALGKMTAEEQQAWFAAQLEKLNS
jgi:hypothetical protein